MDAAGDDFGEVTVVIDDIAIGLCRRRLDDAAMALEQDFDVGGEARAVDCVFLDADDHEFGPLHVADSRQRKDGQTGERQPARAIQPGRDVSRQQGCRPAPLPSTPDHVDNSLGFRG